MDNLAFLHGGNIYEVKRRYRKEVIDFSANINPLGLPPRVKRTIYKNLDKVLHYPDPRARSITQKIAKYWGINEQNILLGNGSVELIYLIVSTYKPKMSLIPIPTFSEYEYAARGINSRIQFLKLKEKEDFKFNLSHLSKSPHQNLWFEGKADIFFLCNPNNPTGNLILEDRKIVEKLTNKLLVVDEAFMDFLANQKNYTLIWRATKDRKIVVLRTFTKFFALPGLRMGYLIAHKEIINKLKQYQPPWNTNSLAQIAAELILNDKEYIRNTKELIEKERRFLFDALSGTNNLVPFPSVTNFLLVKINYKNLTSSMLSKRLIGEGILIRDCANFRGLSNKFIRIAIRSHRENVRLIKALKKVV